MSLQTYSSAKIIQKELADTNEFYGLLIAIALLSMWSISLALLLYLDVSQYPSWLIGGALLWQTFLYTGLFITAHDSIHRTVFPSNPKINDFLGALSATLYALFRYNQLAKNHRLHHRHPASSQDPDFHDGQHQNIFFWYFRFFKEYWSWPQSIGLVAVFNILRFGLQIPEINLILFWIIPPILSSLQLFYFGTFLTHREPKQGYRNPHRCQTISYPVVWSFISCYHFGYHIEHHEYPHSPWWRLPMVWKVRREFDQDLDGDFPGISQVVE